MLGLWNISKVKSVPSGALLRPDPIFVVGMHRSGTSALAGALESFGLTVGKTVMPPHAGQGNPKGFYENLSLANLHDEFLKSIGSDWQQGEPVRNKLFSGSAAARLRKKLVPLLIDEFGSGRPLIKDPRLCRLIPLWHPVISENFPMAQFVLPIRHPLEVACSLRKRDQMPLGHGLKLWVIHVLEGERNTRGFKRSFTNYDQLMRTPVEAVAHLARNLGLEAETAAAAVSDRVDPTLRHHKEPVWPEDEPRKELTLAIHQTLAANEPGREEKLDRLRDEYYGEMGWIGRQTGLPRLVSLELDSFMRRAQS
jgi:O-antigen biosynthesis protein